MISSGKLLTSTYLFISQVLATDEEDNDESQNVLDVYHQKNKRIKPPSFSTHQVPANHARVSADHSRVPADRSHVPADRSHVPADRSHVPAGRSHVPANRPHVPADRSRSLVAELVPADSVRSLVAEHVPADRSRSLVAEHVPTDRPRHRGLVLERIPADRSHTDRPRPRSLVPECVPADRPRPRGPAPERVTANRSHVPAAADGPHVPERGSRRSMVPTNRSRSRALSIVSPDSEDDDDEDNASENDGRPGRAIRNSKTHDPKPSQLSYYHGIWVDILVDARNNYRKYIHTKNPFPEHNSNNLMEAQNFLLEATAAYKEKYEIDEGIFIPYLKLAY